ncbi:hypothetical protein F441_08423 [Phytophthora nicotianae CJ01A1]|uniref:Uncharacterized protein n=3 Tax=Phytophthora nicotianae TaxID=4792 RepID=V9F874_PHYNI|nr:hypothetical protein F443_08447 [Phytophthora nicotianae P1569]ETP17130.1 hypothetical protein F441_08423 [Phytophthora nicotianae CJ01A1]ETP45169.1 hypothetical protein F442_08383 [Phytophthora nicotianae P10297]
MNGSTYVITGIGDHTTQKGKRSVLWSITTTREPLGVELLKSDFHASKMD